MQVAKIKLKGMHALRHVCEARLCHETSDLAQVADHLRQNTLDTARSYAKVNNAQLKKGNNILETPEPAMILTGAVAEHMEARMCSP